ncbi:hypothetical protein N7467_002447 [Penicillium canescens]|nr:hypothetical protein N7467_002447 [Penicillium canescens]
MSSRGVFPGRPFRNTGDTKTSSWPVNVASTPFGIPMAVAFRIHSAVGKTSMWPPWKHTEPR